MQRVSFHRLACHDPCWRPCSPCLGDSSAGNPPVAATAAVAPRTQSAPDAALSGVVARGRSACGGPFAALLLSRVLAATQSFVARR
jgi:hypothetical protein